MENGMEYRMEHAMEWNLFYFFIKAKTALLPAAVCVPIATEIGNRPMDIICSNTWYVFIRGSARMSIPKMSIPIKVAIKTLLGSH